MISVDMKCVPCGRSVFGRVHLIAGTLQCFGAEPADAMIVVHHENAVWRNGLELK